MTKEEGRELWSNRDKMVIYRWCFIGGQLYTQGSNRVH